MRTSDANGSHETPTGIMADMLQSLRASGDDMTAQQLLTLVFLAIEGPHSVNALAESLHLRRPTIALVYPRLVERGLVLGIPNTVDPHEIAITLSTAGHRFVDNLLYRQGRRRGAFTHVPVTASDLYRRNGEALKLG
jgi:DNA-binding MarR family transcriptional regulator